MKKNSHNKSQRLSISKNWPTIKKNYLNHNIYSIEHTLINNIIDYFLSALSIYGSQIITKEFHNKLIILIHILPNEKRTFSHLYLKLNWITNSIMNILNFPLFVVKKNLNSPFLQVKIFNKVFNNQIKLSNLKESVKTFEKNNFIMNKVKIKNFKLKEIYITLNILLLMSNKIRNICLKNTVNWDNKHKLINNTFKLKNKIFFQKLFLRFNYSWIKSLNLKLFIFCFLLNPHYYNINTFLFNWWIFFKTNKKYSNGIKGWSLKFHGKIEKRPRKLKMKKSCGTIHNLKVKTNLKVSNSNYFISNNGISNVKFFLNY